MTTIATIAVASIVVPKDRLRKVSDAAVELLATSIEVQGLLTPIIVRQTSDGKFRLVVGETRLAAIKKLKKKTVRAEVRPVDDTNSASVSDGFAEIDENLARNDLSEGEKKLFAMRWRELHLMELRQQEGISSKSAKGEATRALAKFLGVSERAARWRVQEANEIVRVANWAEVDPRDVARSSIQTKDQLKAAATIIDRYRADVVIEAGNVHQLLKSHIRRAASGTSIDLVAFKAAVDKERFQAEREKDHDRCVVLRASEAARAIKHLVEALRARSKARGTAARKKDEDLAQHWLKRQAEAEALAFVRRVQSAKDKLRVRQVQITKPRHRRSAGVH